MRTMRDPARDISYAAPKKYRQSITLCLFSLSLGLQEKGTINTDQLVLTPLDMCPYVNLCPKDTSMGLSSAKRPTVLSAS